MRLMSLISTTFANRVHATVLFLFFSVFCLLSVLFFFSLVLGVVSCFI